MPIFWLFLDGHNGKANDTVTHHLRTANAFFHWASKGNRRQQTQLFANPWEEITLPKEKVRERLMTEEEFKHLLTHCANGGVGHAAEDLREQLLVLRYTTMRPQELRLLIWDYIDWENHRVVYPDEVVKTRNRREITMIPLVEEVLLQRKNRLEGWGKVLKGTYVFALPAKVNGINLAGMSNRPQHPAKFTQRFRRLVAKCVEKGLIEKEKNGERLVPYSTRHTRITELITLDHSLSVVQFEAGHKSLVTTQRYVHLSSSLVSSRIREKESPHLK